MPGNTYSCASLREEFASIDQVLAARTATDGRPTLWAVQAGKALAECRALIRGQDAISEAQMNRIVKLLSPWGLLSGPSFIYRTSGRYRM